MIDADAEIILNELKKSSGGMYLKDIKARGANIAVTCPFHKGGQEAHPSSYVFNRNDNDDIPFGYFHCFTCGVQGPLYKVVSKCLSCSYEESKEWLAENFSTTFIEASYALPEITLHSTDIQEYLDESILEKYSYFHPYQFERGLTEDIIKKFKIGYNKDTNSITFPVWDEHSHLVGITERRVDTKYFYIPDKMNKPIYLLNYIKDENITEVVVCESQLDALKCWTWGIPAIALFGTGTKRQYNILSKSGIRNYHLALDGDMAGRHGMIRFIENMPADVLIDVIEIPKGKDVNDLCEEEFVSLKRIDKYDWIKE